MVRIASCTISGNRYEFIWVGYSIRKWRCTKNARAKTSPYMTLIQQLLALFNRREHWQLAILLIAMTLQAGAEMIGVASIGPFMSVLADPSAIEQNDALQWAYNVFEFSSSTAFLMALGVVVVGVLAVTNGVSALVMWATFRFSAGAQHRLAIRLVEGYLAQPYIFFVQHNSARLHRNIFNEVKTAIDGVMRPVLTLIARAMVTAAIAALLIFLDPILAVTVVGVLGGAYGTIYLLVRKQQRRLGRERVDANEVRFKVTGEAFGGVKDVKILQRERAFLEQFQPASLRFCRAAASNATVAALPRYLLETVAFGGIVLIALYYLSTGGGVAEVLPMLSLYAFAGYRLMPSLQQLFTALAQIRFNRAALEDLLEDLTRFGSDSLAPVQHFALPFHEVIEINEVTFRYPGASENALEDISLRINHHETIGLVGATGSGKTTLVDLLLGLYEPSGGSITIDYNLLERSTIPAWRQQVGYIPQNIFLTDDTIAHNIAFGVPEEDVNHLRVEDAARVAHLHDFVQALPARFDTKVGEHGVRLSGGQRQRIGIARALYHDPGVLIMDEGTSALDGVTEEAVMDAITQLAGKKTIIIIAHRISTVQDCDCIYHLENGRIRDRGTYHELAKRSEAFRAMAKLSTM